MRFLVSVLVTATLALALGSVHASDTAGTSPGRNGLVAFVHDPACETGPNPPCDSSTIYVVSASGGSARPLIKPFAVGVDQPAWSPSGRRIAFDGDFSIWTASADGRVRRRITASDARGPFQPAWSPDGKKLVFGIDNTSIGVMNADGAGRRILFTGYPASLPTWSPDGRQIMFERVPDVYVMDANGKHVRRLLKDAAWPSWAPDGKSVAFDSASGLSIAAANGRRRRLLVRGCARSPVWSPDGTKLAYTTCSEQSGATSGVYVVNTDGTGRRKLASLDANGSGIAWQPLP